jgi:enoyl-CoA hydratase
MDYEFLTLVVAEKIGTLTVNRPDKLNALNDATIDELGRAIAEVTSRDDIAGLIVTGAGRAFIAGADISELAEKNAATAKSLSQKGQAIFRRFETSPKPVIAAVNGFALGGGCELALACHIRIASDKAKFGQPEVKLGTLPGYGGTQRLARIIGQGRATQLILTAEMIDAQEAYRVGLVNKVVPGEELMGAATAMMNQILANGPLAIAASIEAIGQGLDMSIDEGLALEAEKFGMLAASEDMKEGTTAFLEKRAPVFRGK